MKARQTHPLLWPDAHPRTQSPSRSRFKRFSVLSGIRQLRNEVERLGADPKTLVISMNVKTRRDGTPQSFSKEPKDTGVCAYFSLRGRSVSLPCDNYDRVSDNLRALAKTIAAMREIERHGGAEMLDRAFSGLSTLEAGPAVGDASEHVEWALRVLSLRSFPAHLYMIRRAFEAFFIKNHPDLNDGKPPSNYTINQAMRARDILLAQSKRNVE